MPALSLTPTRDAPALVIRFELEARPIVYVDTLDPGEEARLTDWLLEARPDLGELAARAMELSNPDRV